jgi:hypothetical protein
MVAEQAFKQALFAIYSVIKSPPLEPIAAQMNAVRTAIPYSF